jgi:hypothetical protein
MPSGRAATIATGPSLGASVCFDAIPVLAAGQVAGLVGGGARLGGDVWVQV